MRHILRSGLAVFSIALLQGCATPTSTPSTPSAIQKADTTAVAAPTSTTPSKSFPRQVKLFVTADERLLVNGRTTPVKRVAEKLRKLGVKKNTVIVLDAHPESPFSSVVNVLRTLKKDGYTNVSMRVQEKK